MMRIFSCFTFCAVIIGTFTFSNHAYSQCANLIPGLPAIDSVPCADPFTPNTPSDPSDGPNLAGEPNEPKHVNDSCDADFMNQIYARSFLEANRELMISELLVLKPDSVLEYSCFDQQVKQLAELGHLIPLFSETEEWLNTAGGARSTVPNPGAADIEINVSMGTTRLDLSLNRLVMQSMHTFTVSSDGNFANNLLGGTSGFTPSDTNRIKPSVAAAGTACTWMNDVYSLAKCENINPATFFMRFSDIAGSDPRDTLPANLRCNAVNPITPLAIAVANNDSGTYVFKDIYATYLDLIGEPTSGTCADPIKTGLIVRQEDFNYSAVGIVTPNTGDTREFEEYACLNPGCYYEPTSTGGYGECREAP